MNKEEKHNLIVNGKHVKAVIRKDSEGNIIDTMFCLKKGESGLSPHIVNSNPKESHIDEFVDGEKTRKNRSIKPRLAGVILDLKTGKSVPAPPIILDEKEKIPSNQVSKAREYVKRVKLMKIN